MTKETPPQQSTSPEEHSPTEERLEGTSAPGDAGEEARDDGDALGSEKSASPEPHGDGAQEAPAEASPAKETPHPPAGGPPGLPPLFGRRPPGPGDRGERLPYHIVDGKVYDLKEWIPKHPGGPLWFSRCWGRDISAVVHAYHKDPEKLKKILKKYEVDVPVEDVIHPRLNVPPFLLPSEFNAAQDTPVYGWEEEGTFLDRVKEKLNTKEMQKKLARADFWFDVVGVALLLFHLVMMFVGVPFNWLPAWGFVILFTITRTSLASVGHYHCHRKKDGKKDWGDALFDMQYVGASMVLYDGHVLVHHMYTNSPADIKRTVFTGMLQLPRLWRVPVYTLFRFGQCVTGMFIRWYVIHVLDNKAVTYDLRTLWLASIRFLLVIEFIFCWYTGHLWMWIAQFALCMWINSFLIVSSHDFEESETKADLTPGQDWGVFQVENSFDMSVVGNRYIDCFLTAGLGSHRVHHVLPAQGSGFANIVSEPAVRETCEEFGIAWNDTKNFFLHRLPSLFAFYMLAPVEAPGSRQRVYPEGGFANFLKEHFSWSMWKRMAMFVYLGFRGEGSI